MSAVARGKTILRLNDKAQKNNVLVNVKKWQDNLILNGHKHIFY